MKIIKTILSSTVVGLCLLGDPAVSEFLSPHGSDHRCYQNSHYQPISLASCETEFHALDGLDRFDIGLNAAFFNYSTPSGFGAASRQLISPVSHADDPSSALAQSAQPSNAQKVHSVNSKDNPNNREILNSADQRAVDRLGESQNLPAPLVAAIIVVAVARRKIT